VRSQLQSAAPIDVDLSAQLLRSRRRKPPTSTRAAAKLRSLSIDEDMSLGQAAAHQDLSLIGPLTLATP
jgi:hypothetical protein